MLKKLGKNLLLGFIVGYVFAILLGHWTWLQMRVNTALLVPLLSLLAGLGGLFKPGEFSKFWFLGSESLIILLLLYLYHDPLAFTLIPPIILREAFSLPALSVWQGNLIVILLLITGNILWFWPAGAHTQD